MANAKACGLNPRELAEALKSELSRTDWISRIDVAGPGFLNITLAPSAVARWVGEVLARPESISRLDNPAPRMLHVEFVSVNPNGPITVGSGRGAAFGDTLCRVLRASGENVVAEFYINDALNSEQMRLFALSVQFYLRHMNGEDVEFPENGYKGDYVQDVATALAAEKGADPPIEVVRTRSEELMIEAQQRDLAEFNVNFDRWFSERSLHESGAVSTAIEHLKQRGNADASPYRTEVVRDGKTSTLQRTAQEPGPLWLRSAKFGDEKDRVLVRSDGRPAYIAGDLAYMEDKLGARGHDKSILILGPDHHGYIGRMNAVALALGYTADQFEIVIYQLVRFVKDGMPAPMRKRDGNIYELRDLVKDIGVDAARFFYLMRAHETPMDFDLDLAAKQGDENPVFYVQYAHARISSVLAKAEEVGFRVGEWDDSFAGLLSHPHEQSLIRKVLDLPEEIARAAADYGVHRLATFAVELSRAYHHFYDTCRVIQPDKRDVTGARLALCRASQIALKATLHLLGISAPDRM